MVKMDVMVEDIVMVPEGTEAAAAVLVPDLR
jgi:hypothetical protein